jgi:hypothetical protein
MAESVAARHRRCHLEIISYLAFARPPVTMVANLKLEEKQCAD